MGIYKVEKCVFTGFPVINFESSVDAIEYHINIANVRKHFIRLPYDAVEWEKNNDFFKQNKYLFSSLLVNNKWFEDEMNFISIENLKALLTKADYPTTSKQKLEHLFGELVRLQKEDGEKVKIEDLFWNKNAWNILYFKSPKECMFYMDHLQSEGLIILSKTKYSGIELMPTDFSITYKGLGFAIQLQEEGEKSRKCFVAMSFNASMIEIREAIKEAIIETGYEVILIDEQNIDSDKTINDEIIANLKKCKFCIADFTLHSNGVYFESGFALGQGKKVIYTCRKDEFSNAHFDIKPLQHIIYESTPQLKKNLIDKIHAFID